MSPQCSYFQNYSDLLTLLQCQRLTNVTIAVQVHINLKKKKIILFYFWRINSVIVKSASDAEIPLPRKNRGSTHIYTHARTHARPPACQPACMHACMHASIHTYIHMYTHVFTYIFMRAYQY